MPEIVQQENKVEGDERFIIELRRNGVREN